MKALFDSEFFDFLVRFAGMLALALAILMIVGYFGVRAEKAHQACVRTEVNRC